MDGTNDENVECTLILLTEYTLSPSLNFTFDV